MVYFSMKCFECGSKCVTAYWSNDVLLITDISKVTHVSKNCTVCDWHSFKTKLPEKI